MVTQVLRRRLGAFPLCAGWRQGLFDGGRDASDGTHQLPRCIAAVAGQVQH